MDQSRGLDHEDIGETTDLRKEIRLELLRLKQNKEPEKRTPENVDKLYTNSIYPLIKAVAGELVDYCEVFSENAIKVEYQVSTVGGTTGREAAATIVKPDLADAVRQQVGLGQYVPYFNCTFNLKGFRRGGYDIFDLSISIAVRCEELKYTVQVSGGPRLPTITHFYQEPVTSDEMRQYADGIARHFLETIRQKTKG